MMMTNKRNSINHSNKKYQYRNFKSNKYRVHTINCLSCPKVSAKLDISILAYIPLTILRLLADSTKCLSVNHAVTG